MQPPQFDQTAASLMDYHLYNQAIFAKFQSLVTQLVVDFVLGCLFFFFALKKPVAVVNFVSLIGKRLELEYVV